MRRQHRQSGGYMVKFLISNLKKDRQVYMFIALGVVLIFFADRITDYAPYIVGVALIMYAITNIYMELRYPESEISIGDAVVRGVTGIVLLLEKEYAIAILGIVWAVLSLHDVAGEIDDFANTKKFRLIGLIGIILTLVFSAMLMLDPFEHFAFHLRILGLEMIAETFIHHRENRLAQKSNDSENVTE